MSSRSRFATSANDTPVRQNSFAGTLNIYHRAPFNRIMAENSLLPRLGRWFGITDSATDPSISDEATSRDGRGTVDPQRLASEQILSAISEFIFRHRLPVDCQTLAAAYDYVSGQNRGFASLVNQRLADAGLVTTEWLDEALGRAPLANAEESERVPSSGVDMADASGSTPDVVDHMNQMVRDGRIDMGAYRGERMDDDVEHGLGPQGLEDDFPRGIE